MSWRNPRLFLPLAVLLATGVGFAVYRIVGGKHADLVAAEQAIARRDFHTATRLLDSYLTTQPDDRDARLLAARSARQKGDYEAADHHLGKLLRDSGGDDAELERRLLRAQQGNLPAALSLLTSPASRGGDPHAALTLEAGIVGTLQVLESATGPASLEAEGVSPVVAAREGIDLWLQSRPGPFDQAAGLTWRGRLRCFVGEFADGLTDLRKAVELDPDGFDARFHFARLAGQREPAESLRHLSALHDRHPENATVRFALAGGYRQVGRLDEAAKLLDELLVAKPGDVVTLVARGGVALDQSRPDEAEPFLRRAVERGPENPDAHLALSQCLQLQGRADQARQHRERYEQLTAARPGSAPPP